MKRRRIKLLYALLTLTMALLIALTGTFVPQLMLDAKADRLATGTGAVENGDVSPYTYTMDTETRLPKLAALVEQMSVFGEERCSGVRDPLDTELSAGQVQAKVTKFIEAYASRLEDMGIALSEAEYISSSMAADAPATGTAGTGWTADAGIVPEIDEDMEFLVSPDDQQLSLWFCYAHLGLCDLQIAVDAVTGMPVVITYSTRGIAPDETWCEAVADTYTKLYGESLQFTSPNVMEEMHIGKNLLSMSEESWYGFYCDTKDQSLHLEFQCYYDAKKEKMKDVYFEVYIWLY